MKLQPIGGLATCQPRHFSAQPFFFFFCPPISLLRWPADGMVAIPKQLQQSRHVEDPAALMLPFPWHAVVGVGGDSPGSGLVFGVAEREACNRKAIFGF